MIEAVARDSRAAAEAEYAQAREVTKEAQLALKQARNAQLALVVEQENVTLRMIDQTLPPFAERHGESAGGDPRAAVERECAPAALRAGRCCNAGRVSGWLCVGRLDGW